MQRPVEPVLSSNRAIACGVASMPSADLAAEPGTTLMAMNRTSDAASKVGTNASKRNAISLSMRANPFR